jgi:hypothetical protein
LGKRRTVRFSEEIDRLLEAKAAAESKSISDIIRVSVKAGIESGEGSAGSWILSATQGRSPRDAGPERVAFQKRYRKRHQ